MKNKHCLTVPITEEIDRIVVIDQVVAYLQAQEWLWWWHHLGRFDELMRILKKLEVAGEWGR